MSIEEYKPFNFKSDKEIKDLEIEELKKYVFDLQNHTKVITESYHIIRIQFIQFRTRTNDLEEELKKIRSHWGAAW